MSESGELSDAQLIDLLQAVAAEHKWAHVEKLQRFDGEGGFTVWGKLMPASDSLRLGGLPLGLAHGVPCPLRELLGLVAVAGHGCERAGGDVTGETPQGGLVVGVGEGVGAERTGGHGTQGSGASARRSRTGRYGDAVTPEPSAAEPMRATLDWGDVQPHTIWREAREGACPIIAADDTGLGPGTTYQVLSWDAADAVLRDGSGVAAAIRSSNRSWPFASSPDTITRSRSGAASTRFCKCASSSGPGSITTRD